VAAKEYDFALLSGIFIGRLIEAGDLAIAVTHQYEEKIGEPGKIRVADYKGISQFLTKSKLETDFNELFSPFSLVVKNVGVEKVFFATRNDLLSASKIETDTSMVPEKILDCLTSIRFRK